MTALFSLFFPDDVLLWGVPGDQAGLGFNRQFAVPVVLRQEVNKIDLCAIWLLMRLRADSHAD